MREEGFECTVRIGGNPTGPEYTKIDTDLDTLSILLRNERNEYNGIVRLDVRNGELHIYAHSVKDGFEQRPLAYMLGFNSLSFKLKD